MRAFRSTLALALALTVAAGAPTAHGSGRDVIRDCTDDERFSKTYTQDEYREALADLSTDTDEYTNCRAVIRRAQLAAAGRRSGESGGGDAGGGGRSGGTTGGGGSRTAQDGDPRSGASAAERRALDSAGTDRSPAVNVDGVAVDPTTGASGRGLDELPTPLVVLLLGLVAGALALAAAWLRSRARARRA